MTGAATLAVSEALKDALASQIPQLFAEEMRSFIDKAQRTEAELARLHERYNSTMTELEGKNEKLAQHRNIDEKIAEVARREAKLAEEELKLLRKTIENRAVIAEEKLKTGMEVITLALRNTEIRRIVHGNEGVAVPATPPGSEYPGSQGRPAFATAVPTNSTSTEIKE